MQLLSISDAMSRYEGDTLRKIAETMARTGDYSSIWLLHNEDGNMPASGGYTHFLCATPTDATRDVVSFLMKPSVSNDTRMYGDGQIQKLVMDELDLVIDREDVSARETPGSPAATSQVRGFPSPGLDSLTLLFRMATAATISRLIAFSTSDAHPQATLSAV